jgi:hypothetical protein
VACSTARPPKTNPDGYPANAVLRRNFFGRQASKVRLEQGSFLGTATAHDAGEIYGRFVNAVLSTYRFTQVLKQPVAVQGSPVRV